MLGLLKSKENSRSVLAIDMGTASVSVAVADIHKGGKASIRGVFRYHYDALMEDKSKLLLNSLAKAFLDSYKIEKSISLIKVGFSSPFFVEKFISGESTRQYPKIAISSSEVENLIFASYGGLPKSLMAVSCEIFNLQVDGYDVRNPVGYKGELLKINARVLAISEFLKKKLKDLKNEFFPASEIISFADHDVLRKLALLVFPKISSPVLDIGGEVSMLGSEVLPFGIRSFERKTASFFNCAPHEAESLLRRFSLGTLDYHLERAVKKILSGEVSSLRANIISGAGADFPAISGGAEVLSADSVKERFLSLGALSGGKDAVLAGLILEI